MTTELNRDKILKRNTEQKKLTLQQINAKLNLKLNQELSATTAHLCVLITVVM